MADFQVARSATRPDLEKMLKDQYKTITSLQEHVLTLEKIRIATSMGNLRTLEDLIDELPKTSDHDFLTTENKFLNMFLKAGKEKIEGLEKSIVDVRRDFEQELNRMSRAWQKELKLKEDENNRLRIQIQALQINAQNNTNSGSGTQTNTYNTFNYQSESPNKR